MVPFLLCADECRRGLVFLESGDLSVQPLSRVDCLDLSSGDDSGTSTKGVQTRFGAIVRPFQGGMSLGIEFLQEMLDEGANRIHTAAIGVQPKSPAVRLITCIRIELPVFDDMTQARREVGRDSPQDGQPQLP